MVTVQEISAIAHEFGATAITTTEENELLIAVEDAGDRREICVGPSVYAQSLEETRLELQQQLSELTASLAKRPA